MPHGRQAVEDKGKKKEIGIFPGKPVNGTDEYGKRAGKTFGISAIIAAVFFLFNPEIIYIDVLPDAVGFLLILLGLRRMRDICAYIEESYRKFRNMLIVSAVKILTVIWLFGVNQYERPTVMLLLTFVFGVIDIIWLIPAWNALFDGMTYLADTCGGTAPLRQGKRTASCSYSDTMKRFTAVFVVLKAILTTLPEFSVMSEQLYDDKVMDWYRFIGLFRGAAAIVLLIFGIVWLVRIVRYFRSLIKDEDFIFGLHGKYNKEILPKKGLFTCRRIALVMTLFCAAALLTLDITVDRVNLIPDVLSAAFFAAAFVSVRKIYSGWKYGAAASVLYGAVSTAGWIAENNFHLAEWGLFADNLNYRFEDRQVWTNPSAYEAFWKFYPIKIAEGAVFAVVAVFFFLAVKKVIFSHCGYIPETLDEKYRENRLKDIRRELLTKLYVCIAAAGLLAVSGAISNLIATYSEYLISEIWYLVDAALSIVFLITCARLAGAVNEEAESRYMLE